MKSKFVAGLILVPILSAFFISIAVCPVEADTFHYSFNNLVSNGGGTVTGTVILDPTDMFATSLTIDSNTTGFGLGQYVGSPTANAFTVVSGQITSANFFSIGPTSGACCTLAFEPTPGNNAGFEHSTSTLPSIPVSSDSGVTFTPVVTPLPGALPLFATGLIGFGLLGWRRKKKAAA